MKEIRPWHVLATLASVLALLACISFFSNRFPVKVGEWELRVPRLASFFADTVRPAFAIDSLLALVGDTEGPADTVPATPNDTAHVADIDTVSTEIEIVAGVDSAPAPVVASPKPAKPRPAPGSALRRLEFPPGHPELMDLFYRALRDEAPRKVIRVLHYGDSQVEGDRVTGWLRNRFQREFGGSGPGLLFCDRPTADHATITQRCSGGWRRHSVLRPADAAADAAAYGIMGQTTRFDVRPPQRASLAYRLSPMSYASARRYNSCRLFMGPSPAPLAVEVYGRDSLMLADQVALDEPLNVFGFQIGRTPDNIEFRFASEQSPDFYAVALDKETGVAVDNIPWRGSSGVEFTRIDSALLGSFARQLDVRLVIFQFGVNVVPNVQAGYKWYEERLARQLAHLRAAMGDVPVVVVGVSDMSRKSADGYESYPNIPLIRDAQRAAAFRAGCAFWDLYQAMGGANSMPAWVEARPALAGKDYVHFTIRGSQVIAKMLYDAIMDGYNKKK